MILLIKLHKNQDKTENAQNAPKLPLSDTNKAY